MFIVGVVVVAGVHELDQPLYRVRLEVIHDNDIGV